MNAIFAGMLIHVLTQQLYVNIMQAQKCWEKDEFHLSDRKQMSTRFYASLLHGGGVDTRKEARYQYQRDVAPHRYSSDTSVSFSIEEALKKRSEMAREESTIFEWNVKHAEYSFGANIEDLSMVSALGILRSSQIS